MHTKTTPTEGLDLRCEFDVPRFLDLGKLERPPFTLKQENENFNWFHTQHDFNTPCSQQLEEYLRKKIFALSRFPADSNPYPK
jgi:hypothetical protein